MAYPYDGSALPYPKTDLVPIPGGADPTKYTQASDWNTAMAAMDGLRNQALWAVNVLAKGADPLGVADSTAAIQAAITDAAGSALFKSVYLPPGTYKLTSSLNLGYAGLRFFGAGPASILKVTTNTYAILADTVIAGLTLENFKVIASGVGPNDAGFIQVNKATGLRIFGVDVEGTFTNATAVRADGIAVSGGTSGLIAGCRVTGTPKPGIYIANAATDVRVIGCEVYNAVGYTDGGVIKSPGISVSGCANVQIIGCQSHGNTDDGLRIGTDGTGGGAVASTHISVIGGHFRANAGSNAAGVAVRSADSTTVSRHISISGVEVSENYYGMIIEAGQDVHVSACLVERNNCTGILINNPFADTNQNHTRRITLADLHVSDNALGIVSETGAVEVDGSADVEIRGVRSVNTLGTGGGSYQTRGVVAGATNAIACANLRVLDVDISKISGAAYTFPVYSGTVATSGFYRVDGVGTPNGSYAAPVGSAYRDTTNGRTYTKTTGTGNTGWVLDRTLDVQLAYSATVGIDLDYGNQLYLNVTDGNAFTFSNPTHPSGGQLVTYNVQNGSGGAMGAITWGSAFKLAGAFINPASTKRRTIMFYYDSSAAQWTEIGRAAADI